MQIDTFPREEYRWPDKQKKPIFIRYRRGPKNERRFALLIDVSSTPSSTPKPTLDEPHLVVAPPAPETPTRRRRKSTVDRKPSIIDDDELDDFDDDEEDEDEEDDEDKIPQELVMRYAEAAAVTPAPGDEKSRGNALKWLT